MAKKKRKNKEYTLLVVFLIILLVLIYFFIKQINKNPNTQNAIGNNSSSQIGEASSNNTGENVVAKEPEKSSSPVSKLSDEEIKLSKEHGLPVLMYHFFYDKNAGETGKDNNYMEIHDFEDQVKYLSENNYYVPTWKEVLGYINGKNGLPLKSVVITVDDGDESFFRLAVPVLEKYNFKATSFLITSWYTVPHEYEYYEKSVDFQSHSHDMHKPGSDGKGAFLTKDYNSACEDVKKSYELIGEKCEVFCYPFGHYNENCKKVLKDCNFTLAFTTQGGRVYPGADPYELPRVRMSKGDSLNSFISKIK